VAGKFGQSVGGVLVDAIGLAEGAGVVAADADFECLDAAERGTGRSRSSR
jgi:hypothetical protein